MAASKGGHRTLVELFFITAGLMVAWALATAAIWAYPLGREAIRWCGLAAMAATIAMGLRPLRRAIVADRTAGGVGGGASNGSGNGASDGGGR